MTGKLMKNKRMIKMFNVYIITLNIDELKFNISIQIDNHYQIEFL